MILSFMTKFPGGTETNFVEKILACTGCEELSDSTLERLAQIIAPEVEGGDWMIPEMVDFCRPKLHTIREDAKNRWKPGNKIHFVINNRTKNYLQFAPVKVCVSVQKIEIDYTSLPECEKPIIVIDGAHINNPLLGIDKGIKNLVRNDGFDSIDDFLKYFNTDFKGKIIHWTDLKY